MQQSTRAAAVAALASLGCFPERAFVGVDAVRTEAGVLVLVARADSFAIWRAGDEWVKLSERSGTARACAWHEGMLWVFHRRSISTYAVSPDAVEWKGTADMPFDWPVMAADSGEQLWVCGVREGRIRAGVLRADGWAELPPGPEVSRPVYLDILAEGDGALVAFSQQGVDVFRAGKDGAWESAWRSPLQSRAVALAPGGEIFFQVRSRPGTYVIARAEVGSETRRIPATGQRSFFGVGWALSAPAGFLLSSNSSELRAYARPELVVRPGGSRRAEGWRELSVPDELKGTPGEVQLVWLLIVLGLATATGVLVFIVRLRRFLQGERELPRVEAAPWTLRGLAWALDCGGVLLATGALVLAFMRGSLAALDFGDPSPTVNALILVVWHGVSCLYCLGFELVWGATPGKRLLGLRVVMEDGSRLTRPAAMVRNIFRLIDQYPFPVAPVVGLASMMLTSRQQRLGDLVAGTVVASGRRK